MKQTAKEAFENRAGWYAFEKRCIADNEKSKKVQERVHERLFMNSILAVGGFFALIQLVRWIISVI